MYLKLIYKGKKIGGLTFNPENILDLDELPEFKNDGLTDFIKEILDEYFFEEIEYQYVESVEAEQQMEVVQKSSADALKGWMKT